jgi:adenosine deaminase
MSTRNLIAALPKAELHIHLEGSLEPELLFDLARRNNVSTGFDSVEDLRRAYTFDNLQEFLDIYYVGMRVLQGERDFYDLAMAYFRRAKLDNVQHVEAFFDPQAHLERDVPINAVMNGLLAAIRDAQELELSVYLIPCFLRHLSPTDAMRTLDALEPFAKHFCAVGLDSSEAGNPPGQFAEVFARAHELGLRRVAHAGEEGPPEYVSEALDSLQVDRIDHGNRALENPQLVERLRQQRVPLTVCPLSNLCLGSVPDLESHPLKKMLDAGLAATVNSDDPAYFGGYLNDNFDRIADALELSETEIVTLVKNSFTGSFLPSKEIVKWTTRVDELSRSLSVDTQ